MSSTEGAAMSWTRLDDNVLDHPKIVGLTLEAEAVFYRGCVYINRQQSDGFIPAGVLPQLARGKSQKQQEAIVGALVAAPLWHERTGGWEVHDWSDYARPPRDAEERREAGARGGRRSAEVRRAKFGSAQPPRVEGNPEASASASFEAASKETSKETSKLARSSPPEAPRTPSRPVPSQPITDESLVLLAEHIADPPVGGSPTQRVFEAWKRETGRTGRTVLNTQRQRLLRRALADYDEVDLLDAVRGWRHDPWPDRPQHTELEVLLRPANLEKFRDWERNGPPLIPMPAPRSESAFYRQEADRLRKQEAETTAAALNGSHPPAVDLSLLKSAGAYEEEDQP
jgi:hypothetical protein